jgi:hypothetical protein
LEAQAIDERGGREFRHGDGMQLVLEPSTAKGDPPAEDE